MVFDCYIEQDSKRISIPVPYGGLENLARSVVCNNPDTRLVVCGIKMIAV